MMGRVRASLRTPDPASHPDQAMVRATQGIEGPRSYLGITKDQESLTKAGPSNGVYFINIETGQRSQWLVDHWEVVGQVFIGDIPIGDQKLAPRETPVPYAYPGGGGSVVGVAPRGPNDPPILQPVSGNLPSSVDTAGNDDPSGFNGNILAGVTQTIFSWAMPSPTLPSPPFDQWAGIVVPSLHATVAAGGQIRYILDVGGVTVTDVTFPVDTGLISPIDLLNPNSGYDLGDTITISIEAITATVTVIAVVANVYIMFNSV